MATKHNKEHNLKETAYKRLPKREKHQSHPYNKHTKAKAVKSLYAPCLILNILKHYYYANIITVELGMNACTIEHLGQSVCNSELLKSGTI